MVTRLSTSTPLTVLPPERKRGGALPPDVITAPKACLALIGNPIVGDNKYGGDDNMPAEQIEKKLHLHARRLVLPHPYTGGKIDVTAPLPEHMRKTWELLSLDADRYEDAE